MNRHQDYIFGTEIPTPPAWACAIAWAVASVVSFIGAAFWLRLVFRWSVYLSRNARPPDVHGMPSINSLILEAAVSAVLFAGLGMWMYRRARRKWQVYRRRLLGLCRDCGYDLRSSPDRCPECGRSSGEANVTIAESTPL